MDILKNPLVLLFIGLLMFVACADDTSKNREIISVSYPDTINLDKSVLADKIKGGWAGQLIGCTYGGPTEFKYKGGFIHDYVPIHWDSTLMDYYFTYHAGLYDDIYMDLTFVDVIEKHGIDAPARLHAEAFANAKYPLWHANQAARYNILNGMYPPASGYWKNNPHADDIDFQIEADFAGLMAPGLVNAATRICDTVGHIMNYGDGWYGGVYVASMYSLAFVFNDVPTLVREALTTIPEQSTFHQCISDVIKWSEEYPDDWKKTWFFTEKKWGEDKGCPDGVFSDFNIDAKLNAAYIVVGLLYGEGDFGKTTDISTRCGQDSDCNPASAAGILGAMIGYSNIPEYWKQGIEKVADRNFIYTTLSMKDVYELGMKHALQLIEREGGKQHNNSVSIPIQKPNAVKFEQCFEGLQPIEFINRFNNSYRSNTLHLENPEAEFSFQGSGFVLNGQMNKAQGSLENITQQIQITIDGNQVETVSMPTDFTSRKHDIYWNYALERGEHHVKIRLLEPKAGYNLNLNRAIIYAGFN